MKTFTEMESSGLYTKYFLRDFRSKLGIGVYGHEIGKKQELVINIEALVPNSCSPEEKSALRKGFNYDSLKDAASEACTHSHTALQETIVARIAERLLNCPEISALKVRTEKTEAYNDARSAGIERIYIPEAKE